VAIAEEVASKGVAPKLGQGSLEKLRKMGVAVGKAALFS